MRNSCTATRVGPVATAAILLLMLASPSAQRRGGAPANTAAPVATNAILQHPEEYYGKPVTMSAGVEQMLSKTAFLVDQRKAVSATEMKAVGAPIMVIAPYLHTTLEQKPYLLMSGQVVKLDAAAVARVAADYKLDLPPEISQKYMGQPVLIATSVIDSKYTELAKKPLPPPSPAEISLSTAMKSIGPAFAALRTATQDSKVAVALITENAAKLAPAFTRTEAVWDDIGQGPAAQWAREARAYVTTIDRAAAAGDWDGVKLSTGKLDQLCQNCHASYRERQPDGAFRVTPGLF